MHMAKPLKQLSKLTKKLDNNLIKVLLIGFIFIVPLYPKFPLIRVNFTYIAIRFEDLYLAFMVIIFFLQYLRKKVSFSKKFLLLFLAFWVSVFISYFLGVVVFKTVDYPKLGFLHAARRVEYMIVFFIAASVIRLKKDFYQLLSAFLISLTLVNLYAVGQKFFNLPAVQTMNPEFAKGRILYLTPEARVSSTFAGHYDLAAYLVFLIPLTLGYYYSSGKKVIFALFLFSILILTYTASRISFISYIFSVSLFLIFLRKFRMLVFVLLLSFFLMFATKDLTKRFSKTLQIKQILVNQKTGEVYVPQKITTKELPAGSFYIKLKKQPTKENANVKKYKKKIIKEEVLEEATKSGIASATEEGKLAATLSANIKPVNTVISDISFATRLQVEWPRAIHAFLRDPLFGEGPSSITEATDNDYLRWLGEIGGVGTLLFLGIIFSISLYAWNYLRLSKYNDFLVISYIFGVIGLLLNASYIDVFEASKDAYVFWTFTGGLVSYILLLMKRYEKKVKES